MRTRTSPPPLALPRAAIVPALLAMLSTGCGRGVERDAHAEQASPAPEAEVAAPVVASVDEYAEYTSRAEAVDRVEIRPRVAGYLQRTAFAEGDMVKKGDLLFVVDPRPAQAALARARADLALSRADHDHATRDTARASALFASAAIAEREWDAQRSGLLVSASREDAARAALSAASLELDFCYVRAPIGGRTGRVMVTPGNLVSSSTASALTTVVSLDPLYVYADVDEGHALALGRDGLRSAPRALVAFGDEATPTHEGRVDFVDNTVDARTGTQKVRVVVPNPKHVLVPGLFARVRISERTPRESVLVADDAIGTDQDRRFVLVVDGEGVVAYRAVELGRIERGLRVVVRGLERTDRVIVRGLHRVRPGAKVSPKVVAMARETDGGAP